ncbi:MAG: glutaredoxin family protein [Burkholderiales bacterium]|nr:glutaredoxin family protein [Burkholderiales bacterium]
MRDTLIFALAAVMVASVQAAEVYRWIDKEGKVVYSDTPPPADAKNPQLRKLGKNAIDVDKLPFATRDAVKKNPVTLYANNCGPVCDSARSLLAKRGIPFIAKNPESSPVDADALKKLIGAVEVPVLVVGTNSFKGFEAAGWEAALDAAGYPKTAALTQPSAKSAPQSPPDKPQTGTADQSEAGVPALK